MSIERKVNQFLSDYPVIKKITKRLYQVFFYLISPKKIKEGNIEQISPDDDYEYFFGYYDKSPWDQSNRYMLSLRVKDTTKGTAPKETADIILFDTKNDNKLKKISSTKTWNIQQGAMLQWLGPDYSERIIYNDYINGKYCSVILNVNTNEKKIIDKPIYSVAEDGRTALTLDFSRLHSLRPGYGYSNTEDITRKEKIPNSTAIWKIDLLNNKSKSLLSYRDFYNFERLESMEDSTHKINHIMINPSGTRFMVLHRWSKQGKKRTRLVTADLNGENLYNLNDDGMTSHCIWKSDEEILGYAHKKIEGDGYYLMQDKTQNYKHKWNELKFDGHPSYSPDKKSVITDTYPNRSRMASVYLIEENEVRTIAKVFAPFKYDNDFRCDLHPRWDRNGENICIDSVHEGKRGLYVIKN